MFVHSACLQTNVLNNHKCKMLSRLGLTHVIKKTTISQFLHNEIKIKAFSNYKKVWDKKQLFSPLIWKNKFATVTTKPHVSKAVGYWFLGCGAMVYIAVTLGGVTRLTESGLSMVTWKLLGEKRPVTKIEWDEEFEKYKQFPEFKIKNKDMTVDEFKWIWWMEYGHRSWGRLIGAAFFIPASVFWMSGKFTPIVKKRVVACGILIAAQGLMGWYMVKSGLQDRFHGQSDIPRVSQYRLAAHLGLAFTLYTALLWSSLGIILPSQKLTEISASARKLRMLAHASKGLVFLTALSGAFVAGLDAGLVYNSFPKMADKWIPEDTFALSPVVKNFTENPTTVQLDHRILGTTTLGVITATWYLSRRCHLPPRAHLAATCLATMAWLQVSLGIATLLMYVPTPLAASHQSGSLLLLSIAIWLSHELKHMKKLAK